METDSSSSVRPGNKLPRTVVAIAWASFFTDFSGEMIYPLLPAFLAGTLGAGTAALGTIEGFAEATASILKAVSGRLADRAHRRRKPFVLAGYGLSGAVRPLIGLSGNWPSVLAIRVADRFGKGVRGAPRDALIADVTAEGERGRAYGFQQAMDHAGAVIGPLIAAWLLSGLSAFRRAGPLSLRQVFLLAAIPGIFSVAAIALGVKESGPRESAKSPAKSSFSPSLEGLRELGPGYLRLLVAVFVFTLGNSTDAFLLMRLGDAGIPPSGVAALWGAHHVVKALCSLGGGHLADRCGARRILVAGWLWYAAIYLAFALVSSPVALVAVFLAYGVYFGLGDPAQSAWVATLAGPRLRGTAFGYFSLAIGLAALPASLIFGLVWRAYGASAAFGLGAFLAACGCLLLLRVPGVTQDTGSTIQPSTP